MRRYRFAVGLRYDERSGEAPSLCVKGQGWMADEIVKLARRFGVPVIERQGLARALVQLEEDKTIPERLFEAVAKVLAELERRLRR